MVRPTTIITGFFYFKTVCNHTFFTKNVLEDKHTSKSSVISSFSKKCLEFEVYFHCLYTAFKFEPETCDCTVRSFWIFTSVTMSKTPINPQNIQGNSYRVVV